MSSTETGEHPAIYKVDIIMQEIKTINIWEADLNHFLKELQTKLLPALEVMSVNIQHLELN